MIRTHITLPLFLCLLCLIVSSLAAAEKPLMKDFMGVCGHTVQFKPKLYRPAIRLVRDYHPIQWDLGDDTASKPPFPEAANRVDWSQVYGAWRTEGFDINACLMFDNLKAEAWKDIERDAFAYGKAFAEAFGPSGERKLVDAIEIGNEPGEYDDATYRKLFEAMAKGVRAGDPKLAIVTCAANAGPSGRYFKSLDCVKGLEPLYEAINVHTYAQIDNWPTWRRGHPESKKNIDYLTRVTDIVRWRDQHAADKQIWITEFGWDSTTKPQEKTGTFSKWEGVTDTQQAQYIVRSFLVFSAMAVDRAYLYFFNDNDEPKLHAAAGLTRHFKPKPSYWATAHMQTTLSEYRFAKVIEQRDEDLYVYAFTHATEPERQIWVAWSPTGSDRSRSVTLKTPSGRIDKAERMPLKPDAIENISWKTTDEGITFDINESPTYLWITPR